MLIGLVGCGRWGVHILRDLRALGCEVHVVAPSADTVTRARDGGAAAIVPSLDRLGAVDGLVVATPATTHADVIEQALSAGVPVFVEKPLCTDAGAAARLVALGRDRVFVMDKWRYHPGILEIAAIAREQRLGRVLGLRTTRVGWGPTHDDIDATWVLAPHDLAIALEVLGVVPRPVAAVAARDDAGRVALNGLLDAAGAWHALEVSEWQPTPTRRIELHCEDGLVVLGGGWDDHISIYRAAETPDEERIATPGELPLLAELRAFVDHLGGGPPPRSSVVEGAEIVEAITGLCELAGLT